MNEEEKLEYYMKIALLQAKIGFKLDEVPVGAVIVKENKIIAKAYNLKESKKSAVYHAEILAINKASKKLKSWNLTGCSIFITMQPCLMCYGAILSSRISSIYFGAYDKKYGLEVEKYNELNTKGFNHKANIIGGVLEEECSQILTDFFKVKR